MASKKVQDFCVKGLVSPPATIFDENGDIDLSSIPDYVKHFLDFGVPNAFVTGTTGEGKSMTVEERKKVAEAWVASGKGLLSSIVVHIGTENVRESQELARHAEAIGADAIACVGTSYYKPENLEQYVFYMRDVASAAPNTPFYLYDIDFFTGIPYTAAEFFSVAHKHIPTLRGVKHTSSNLVSMTNILMQHGSKYQVMLGTDEYYLEGLALGLDITVGNSYMGHVLRRIKEAFDRGDMDSARMEQRRAVKLHDLRRKHKFTLPGFAKSMLRVLGMKAGNPRPPFGPVDDSAVNVLHKDLKEIGYFEWGTKY